MVAQTQVDPDSAHTESQFFNFFRSSQGRQHGDEELLPHPHDVFDNSFALTRLVDLPECRDFDLCGMGARMKSKDLLTMTCQSLSLLSQQ